MERKSILTNTWSQLLDDDLAALLPERKKKIFILSVPKS